MTKLARSTTAMTIRTSHSAHPGLLLTRGLTDWDEVNPTENGEEKRRLIEKLAALPVPLLDSLYGLAYQRWQGLSTNAADRFAFHCAETAGRLFIGLSSASALETGASVQHTYGMPMIPGSSVKGCAQAYAKAIGMAEATQAVLFGAADVPNAELATNPYPAGAGCVVWHDAWWIPVSKKDKPDKPFALEIVTVHHQAYYNGEGEATDFDSPIPNAQLAVQGNFYFVVEGDPAWTTLAVELLDAALREQGIGAKRAAGYGLMFPASDLQRKYEDERRKAQKAGMSVADQLLSEVQALSPDMLYKALGKDKTKTKEHHGDNWSLFIALIAEHHAATLESWKNSTDKQHKRILKLVSSGGKDGE